MKVNSEEIIKMLPHRYPFLLVDRVQKYKTGLIECRKNITINEPYFQGHFPGEPVMPGVLIIEAMAQAGAVAILSLEQYRGKTAYFGGIKNARFKRKVVPGDQLRLEVKISSMRMNMGLGIGTAYVGDEVAASGELIFAVG